MLQFRCSLALQKEKKIVKKYNFNVNVYYNTFSSCTHEFSAAASNHERHVTLSIARRDEWLSFA